MKQLLLVLMIFTATLCNAQVLDYTVFMPREGYWDCNCEPGKEFKARFVNVTNDGYDIEFVKCPGSFINQVHLSRGVSGSGVNCSYQDFYTTLNLDSFITKRNPRKKQFTGNNMLVHVIADRTANFADCEYMADQFALSDTSFRYIYALQYSNKSNLEAEHEIETYELDKNVSIVITPLIKNQESLVKDYYIEFYIGDYLLDVNDTARLKSIHTYFVSRATKTASTDVLAQPNKITKFIRISMQPDSIVAKNHFANFKESGLLTFEYHLGFDLDGKKYDWILFSKEIDLSRPKEETITYPSPWKLTNDEEEEVVSSSPKHVSSEILTEAEAEQMYTGGNNTLTGAQVQQATSNYEGNAKIKASEVNTVKGRQRRLNDLIKQIEDKRMVFFDTAHNEVQMQVLKQISSFMKAIPHKQDNLDKVEMEMVIDLAGVLNEFIEKGLKDDTTVRDSATIEMYSKIIRSLEIRMREFQLNDSTEEGYDYRFDKSHYNMLLQSLCMPLPPPGATRPQCFASISANKKMPDGSMQVATGYTIYYRDLAMDDIGRGQIFTLGTPTSPAVGQIPPGVYKFWLGDSVTEEILSIKKKLEVTRSNTKENPAVSFIAFKPNN